MSETPETDAKEKLRDRILAERKAGNVVVWGFPGELRCMPIDDFVQQPADGMLYDLNRLEEISLTFLDDPKWVNDFAVALTIRKLIEQRNSAERQRDEAAALLRDILTRIESDSSTAVRVIGNAPLNKARQFLATLDRTEKT
jgi:hypothetical protein